MNLIVITPSTGQPITVHPAEGVPVKVVPAPVPPIAIASVAGIPGASAPAIVDVSSTQSLDGVVTVRVVMSDGVMHEFEFQGGSALPPIELALAGSATGFAAAIGSLRADRDIAGAAFGTTTISATLGAWLDLASVAAASGSATARLAAALDLAGAATSRGSAAGQIFVVLELAGAAVGRAQASGMLHLGTDLTLQATATGRATAEGMLLLDLTIVAAAVGRGLASGTVQASSERAGAATDTGRASGALLGSVALAGSATRVWMTSGALLLEAGGSYNADAQAVFNAMTVQPSSQLKSLYNALILNLKADGLWSKLDWLCIMAAHDAQAARLKLRAPAKSLAAVNTPAFVVDRGYAGDNLSSHLSFGEAFNATGNVYSLNSAHLGVWCSAQGATDGIRSHIGSSQSTRSFITPSTAGAGAARINDSSPFNLGAAETSLGGRILTRTGALARAYYRNGALGQSDMTASSAIATGPAYLLRNGTAYTDDRLSAATTGSGLTASEVQALHNRINTFLTNVGVVGWPTFAPSFSWTNSKPLASARRR